MLASEHQEPRMLDRAGLAAEKRIRMPITCSFLRLLHDLGIIRFKKKDGDYELSTTIKMQGLTFFASRFFGLPASYYYSLVTRGPQSLDLVSDYYGIKKIKDHDAITETEWPRMGEFLEFVKDRDHRWLEVAATLVFVKAEEGMDGDRLVEHVGIRQRCRDTQAIYDELERLGMLGILDIGDL